MRACELHAARADTRVFPPPGRFETEEEARKATKAAIADVTSPAQLCSGIIEFVASEHVEAVALDPSAAEFPHGIINRPRGVQLDRKTFKWRAFININLERVHLGTCHRAWRCGAGV